LGRSFPFDLQETERALAVTTNEGLLALFKSLERAPPSGCKAPPERPPPVAFA
jgi:hypothetical protein